MNLNSNLKKYLFSGAFLFSIFNSVYAQTKSYVPLVPDLPISSGQGGSGLGTFLLEIFQWGTGVAVALAVLMIILGGVQYMTTDAFFKKEQGKERIKAAVIGLLLALSGWLILNQINPDILKNTNLALDPINVSGGVDLPGGGGGLVGAGNNQIVPYVPGTGGSVEGIPYGGAYNPTLQSALGGNGIENLAQLKIGPDGKQWVGGRVSTFGGPNDTGVSLMETGAISGEVLRQLDPNSLYIAGRWDYTKTSKSELQNRTVTVYNPATGQRVSGVKIVDWGPNTSTGRVWDVSPGAANAVGVKTDGDVWVTFD